MQYDELSYNDSKLYIMRTYAFNKELVDICDAAKELILLAFHCNYNILIFHRGLTTESNKATHIWCSMYCDVLEKKDILMMTFHFVIIVI